jgi:hypothetical protein
MTIDSFAVGETVVARDRFSPSPILFWLKTELVVTEKRISGTTPNTFLGIIPLGSSNVLFPLKQVSGIGVNNKIKPIRIALGLLLAVAGLSTFGNSFFAALLMVLFGVSLFLGGLTAALEITNNAGSTQRVIVTLFDKTRLQALANVARQHLVDL